LLIVQSPHPIVAFKNIYNAYPVEQSVQIFVAFKQDKQLASIHGGMIHEIFVLLGI
jgi:hypothetical protein